MAGIVLICDSWATNVGNSFFHLGALHALRTAAANEPVYLMPNLAERLWKTEAYDPLGDVDADLWLFSGPIFYKGLGFYTQLLELLRSRGKRLGFLSAGLWTYSDEEWRTVRDFLESYQDMISWISSRDHRTYSRVKEFDIPTYDGICGSMFLPDIVQVPRLERSPYVVLNFQKEFEPTVRLDPDRGWTLAFPAARPPRVTQVMNAAARLKWRSTSKKFAPRPGQRCIGDIDIIRTSSRRFHYDATRIFDRANMHYSDLPVGALAIYKSAEAVFTDRVHTAAATLALGGAAQFSPVSKRAKDGRWSLLERAGAEGVTERPTRLDPAVLATEKAAQIAFLRGVIGTA